MTTVFWGLMIPFAGTTFGAACVFFMKREMHDGVRRALMGFAAGVMIYVVIEELIPEATRDDKTDVCTIGFAVGFALMMVLDVALS